MSEETRCQTVTLVKVLAGSKLRHSSCNLGTRMTVARLQRLLSRSGQPTVQVDGVAYHSAYDPQREAQKFYSGFQLEQADVVLHFGWGLGYCGDVLLGRTKPGARVIVFEPDADLYNLSGAESGIHNALYDRRIQFVVGDQVRHFFDEWPLGDCQETDQFLWIEWPAALRDHGALAELLRLQLKQYIRDRAANLLTHFQRGERYFQNTIRNFNYQRDADAGRLFGCFRDVPLVIVSAGPSLDQNIQELRGNEDRCFILSVDTALRPLLAAGITPHAVITADPSEMNARHISGVMPSSTYLIAEQAVQPEALESAAKRFLFSLGLFPDSLFAKFGFGKTKLEAWGSVATTALDLACRMGANPIIFAGQDFAYSWDRDYASHTLFHGKTFVVTQAATIQRPDLWGNNVHTTENLVAYRDFFVRRMKQSPGVRFINGTEGGILTEGVEVLQLGKVIGGLRSQTVDIAGILADCCRPSITPGYPAVALAHLEKALKSRDGRCDCLNGFLELTAKEHLLHKNNVEIEKKISWGTQLMEELEY
jgi:hypothetical protein